MCECVNLIAAEVNKILNKNRQLSSRIFGGGSSLPVRKELFMVPPEKVDFTIVLFRVLLLWWWLLLWLFYYCCRYCLTCCVFYQTQNASFFVDPNSNIPELVSNTAVRMNDWSIDGLGASKDSQRKDSVHMHLSFQSRVGPVQWLK